MAEIKEFRIDGRSFISKPDAFIGKDVIVKFNDGTEMHGRISGIEANREDGFKQRYVIEFDYGLECAIDLDSFCPVDAGEAQA